MLRPAETLLPEKRKVGSSTVPLTTSTELSHKALTSKNESLRHRLLRPHRGRCCPFVIVFDRAMLHVRCTTPSMQTSLIEVAEQPGAQQMSGRCVLARRQRAQPVGPCLSAGQAR